MIKNDIIVGNEYEKKEMKQSRVPSPLLYILGLLC